MSAVQQAKSAVAAFLEQLDAAGAAEVGQVLSRTLAPDHRYRGVHPFNTLNGPDVLGAEVYAPLKQAIGGYQRRLDMFFAGAHQNAPDGTLRVVVMGQILGFFTAPWLGIPATGKAVFVPFTAFYEVREGLIADTVEFFDLLAVMEQAGCNPCTQTASFLMSPGPRTHNGVHLSAGDADETAKTLALTDAMLTELVETMTSPEDHLTRFWHPDMTWFGPTGIGTCYGLEGYVAGHTGPFEERLAFVEAFPEELAIAEGHVAAYLWRPALKMRNLGGYMGMPTSDVAAEMRIVDLYRRDGDKLAENWIFIDMLHFLKEQGVDVLAGIGQAG